MTAQALNTPNPAPDTETRVIVELMLALRNLIERRDMAQEAGSLCLNIYVVRAIATAALINAQDNAPPTPADPVERVT